MKENDLFNQVRHAFESSLWEENPEKFRNLVKEAINTLGPDYFSYYQEKLEDVPTWCRDVQVLDIWPFLKTNPGDFQDIDPFFYLYCNRLNLQTMFDLEGSLITSNLNLMAFVTSLSLFIKAFLNLDLSKNTRSCNWLTPSGKIKLPFEEFVLPRNYSFFFYMLIEVSTFAFLAKKYGPFLLDVFDCPLRKVVISVNSLYDLLKEGSGDSILMELWDVIDENPSKPNKVLEVILTSKNNYGTLYSLLIHQHTSTLLKALWCNPSNLTDSTILITLVQEDDPWSVKDIDNFRQLVITANRLHSMDKGLMPPIVFNEDNLPFCVDIG